MMLHKRHIKNQAGLTLVEMLMALLIFAIIAATTVTVLRLAINGKEQTQEKSLKLTSFDIARALIKSDLLQATNRRVRDEFGQSDYQAFAGGVEANRLRDAATGELLLRLVANGNTNFDHREVRSTLQFIEYIYEDQKIIRRARVMLDATSGTPFRDQVLYNNIQAARVEFFDGVLWGDNWESTDKTFMPRAVALEIEHEEYGIIRQLFYTKQGR